MNNSNEEKAKEIASKYERWNIEEDESAGAYKGALEMAQWKEQQMIEKAVKFLERQKRLSNVFFDEDFIYFFKEQMMEEN